jgi:hypothetical protein
MNASLFLREKTMKHVIKMLYNLIVKPLRLQTKTVYLEVKESWDQK